jgi:hypothetical protein
VLVTVVSGGFGGVWLMAHSFSGCLPVQRHNAARGPAVPGSALHAADQLVAHNFHCQVMLGRVQVSFRKFLGRRLAMCRSCEHVGAE